MDGDNLRPADKLEHDDLLARILDEVARGRALGKVIDDAEVVAAYPALMPELREQLAALRRVEDARSKARHADVDNAHGPDSARMTAPMSIPGCELTREVFRGGQAVVYKAFHPATRRYVAVKVMRDAPFYGPSDRARFRREVRILAQLRHPNIVSVHDSGTSMGCHYFVMDFIEGQTLDAFLSVRRLAVPEILRLFIKVCRAVNAAHLRGVIHRDLKPSNIRVDEAGEPHVLDFGLAKMATEEIHEASQWRNMTMTGQFVGSLPWASPEQAAGHSDRIDLRTDIYSLGVVLYQMLTGRLPTPFEGNVPRMLARIMESEPVRPSLFRTHIDEDVDTITLKCLAKEPERRYQSAATLAEDVERYLAHLPIQARTPSTIYQLQKLIRRHRLPFGLLVALCVTSLAFAVGMSALYARTRSAESREAERRIDAEREAETARAIKEFLVEDLLAAAKPENTLGRKVTLEEVLASASQRIESAFDEQPEIEASIRSTLGQVYQTLGKYDAAARHYRVTAATLRQLYGPSDHRVLRAELDVAATLASAGHIAEAAPIAEDALALSHRTLGADAELTLAIAMETGRIWHKASRFAEVRALLEDTSQRCSRLYGDHDARTAAARGLLADVATFGTERRVATVQALGTTLEEKRSKLGEEHPETLRAKAELGFTLLTQRQFEEAEPYLRGAHDELQRVLGTDHAWSIRAARHLGVLLREQGRVDESGNLCEIAVAAARRALGGTHPETLEEVYYLGTNLLREAKYADANAVFEEVMRHLESAGLGRRHQFAAAVGASGFALLKLGRYVQAESRLREAIAIVASLSQPDPAWFLSQLVAALGAQGKVEDARPFAQELLDLREAACTSPDADAYALNCYARELLTVTPEDLRDPEAALSSALLAADRSPEIYHYNRYTVARAYEAVGELQHAMDFARRALDHSPLEFSSDRAEYETLLVRLLEETGDLDGAERVYRDTLAARRADFPRGHADVAASLFDLGNLLNRRERFVEAEACLRESLETLIARLADGEHEHYGLTVECEIAETRLALAKSLLARQLDAEAERLLLAAYARFADNEHCHADNLPAAAAELAAFYRSRNQPELAAEYEVPPPHAEPD